MERKRQTLPLAHLWSSPSLPQTLAHWSLPAPPSTLTQKNIVQHITGSDRNLHRGMTGQPAFTHGFTLPNLEWPQMTDDGYAAMQDVPEPSDSAPCCLWNCFRKSSKYPQDAPNLVISVKYPTVCVMRLCCFSLARLILCGRWSPLPSHCRMTSE